MSEKSPTTRKTSKSKLHFFGSAMRRNKQTKKDACLENKFQGSNDIPYEKETLLECESVKVELGKHHEKEDKKHKLSESLKNAGKGFLPHLGTPHRHKKLTRQRTIDIGDIKSAIKAQEAKQVVAGGNGDEDAADAVAKTDSMRSLAHLDLAEISHSHRRTAVCDELEKFTVYFKMPKIWEVHIVEDFKQATIDGHDEMIRSGSDADWNCSTATDEQPAGNQIDDLVTNPKPSPRNVSQ